MYHFTKDDEALAWRVIGLAARHCLEPDEQAAAIRTFWCIYVLDRRWSFGTGMPFALQDTDIDSNLPKPVRSVIVHQYTSLLMLVGRLFA
jgi:hypothetical protein